MRRLRRSAERAKAGSAVAAEFVVNVIPRAKKTELAGERNGALVVRVAAPPVEGAANDALVDFFARALRVPRGAVRIVAGERSRQKRIAIAGVTADDVRALK